MDQFSAELESLRKRVKELEASDIDLRKRLEILGLCESWYRQIIDDQTDFICRFLWDETITFINRALSSLIGKSPEDLMGTSFRDIIPAEDVPMFQSRLSTLTQGNPVTSFEHGLRIDGDMSWQQWTVRSIYDRRGKLVEYQAVGRDITARKKAEDLILNAKNFLEQMVEKRTNELEEKTAQLAESESRYRTIFENTGAATFIIEEDMTISFFNSEFERVTGYSKKEFEGKMKWTALIPEKDLNRLKENHRLRRIDPDVVPRTYDIQMIDKAGRVKDIFVMIDMIPGTGKSVASLLDITDRRIMERQIQESEKRYRTIFQTTGAVMAILEEDMTVSLVNDRTEHYLGFSREEIEGKRKWVEFVPAEEKEKTLEYDRLLNIDPASAPRSFETRVIHKDGSTRDFFVTADLIPGTKSRVVSLIDITERKRAEMELRERERDLELRTRGLEEMNSALNVLLKKIESDKQDLIENIKINIHEMVSPPIEKLKRCQLGEMQKYYVKTLERNLQTITSPFVKSVKSKYPELSPKEVQIINFIKEGRTTKEIAAILSITIKAVEFHRYNIRKKFRLTRKKSTLAAHLSKI